MTISDTDGDPADPGAAARSPLAAPGPEDLFRLELEDLGRIEVRARSAPTNAPSNLLESRVLDFNEAGTTGELLRQAGNVTVRRTSAINLDPRVRGYHSEQIGASAAGMSQLKTRIDIDSLFSQIDPGIVERIEVIDGPYTSLYGPGFAFLIADLHATQRYPCGPETHGSALFTHGSNGRTIYTRENVWGGGQDWGLYASYGLRLGNDYHTGDRSDGRIPASFHKWDGFLSISRDMTPSSRLDFMYLRTEINDTELPGVVYDINNSRNDQFNLRYVVQECPQGPEQFVLQYWFHQTAYYGDASRESKQRSLYRDFFTLPVFDDWPINTLGSGRSDSMGLRSYFTFGDAEAPQWTVGTDWRRFLQVYREQSLDSAGETIFDGNIFGIPQSRRDDVGAFTHLRWPVCQHISMTVGGRLDWTGTTVDGADPVVRAFTGDPDDFYFDPGFEEPEEVLGMAYATVRVRLPGRFVFNAGAAHAERSPTLAELYSDEPYVPLLRFGNSYVTGQSTLKPEGNWQFDAGLTYEGDYLFYGVRGFHSEIHDYIWTAPAFLDPSAPDAIDAGHTLGRDFTYFDWRTDLGTANENADTNQAGYIYTNIDRATISGVDGFIDVGLRHGVAVGGKLAYVRGTNHAPVMLVNYGSDDMQFAPTVASEPLPGIYPFHGSAWIRFFDPEDDRWAVELLGRLVRGQNQVARTLSELPTAGFAVWDLRGHVSLATNFRVTVAVKNLLDRAYTQHGSLVVMNKAGRAVFVPEPGIHVLVGGEWRF